MTNQRNSDQTRFVDLKIGDEFRLKVGGDKLMKIGSNVPKVRVSVQAVYIEGPSKGILMEIKPSDHVILLFHPSQAHSCPA